MAVRFSSGPTWSPSGWRWTRPLGGHAIAGGEAAAGTRLPPRNSSSETHAGQSGLATPLSPDALARACSIEVIAEDGSSCFFLDLVLSSRRLPLLDDVPLSMRPQVPVIPGVSMDAGRLRPADVAAWAALPSLPPAAPAPRLPRLPRRPPPPPTEAPPSLPADVTAFGPRATRFPYIGDVRGATWNSQAMFARKRQRHDAKAAHVRRLLQDRDFLAITDTHGLEGGTAAWSCPADCRAWWSPGTTRRAGVGVVVKRSFLELFGAVEPGWHHIVPGRSAVLQLRGSAGAMDIHVVYFATGVDGMVVPRGAVIPEGVDDAARQQRCRMMGDLAAAIAPAREVLSIVLGDFNWVVQKEDRIHRTTANFSGEADRREEQRAQETLWRPSGLYEIQQDEMTHENAKVWSRIDRVYWNADVSSQLDRALECGVLEWVPALSAHRLLVFARRTPERVRPESRPVRPEILSNPRWPVRVAAELQELRQAHARTAEVTPLVDLRLLKLAMRTVADRMSSEAFEHQASPQQRFGEQHTRLADAVGTAIRFVRAAERGNTGVMRRCLADFPRLQGLHPRPLALSGCRGTDLQPYRDLIVELARAHALDELTDLSDNLPHLEQHEAAVRRGRIHRLLRRLSPGRTSCLAAVADAAGRLHTEPSAMAAELRRYWSDVFAQRPVVETELDEWIADDVPPRAAPPEAPCWALHRRHVQQALDQSPNSAPGPDGLPFQAWRSLGPLAVDVLWTALQRLTDLQEDGDMELFLEVFNSSLLVLLPKGGGTVTPEGSGHRPEDTRPLNVANTDNRLLANAVRLCVEGPLSEAVSLDQRGFVPGRSMLANVLDVDEAMQHVALSCSRGAAWFFDFKAAFPSVAHKFLLKVLGAAGLPRWLLIFVERLYVRNRCNLVVGGSLHRGFEARAGIRQGCPLSPMLFAVAMDILLRKLRRRLPSLRSRAFADDVASVAPDMDEAAPVLH